MTKFYLTASALALTAMMHSPAIAQTTSDADAAETTGDQIVVQGFRQQNRQAVAAKRDTDVIADFLGSDDLGKTADLNIADSLRRVAGVNTIFDEDEGRYVSIRGLESNFTYIAFDGSQLASVDRNSRRVNTEMIPPTAVKRLEVYKTLTPEYDGNAIGGYVNLVSRSAYDVDDTYLVGSAQVGIHSFIDDVPGGSDDLSPRFDLGFSTKFGANEEFGIVLAGTYFDKTRDQARALSLNFVDQGGGDIRADRQLPLNYTNTIERRSFLGKAEFKPSDDVYAYASYGYFDYQYDEVRHLTDLDGRSSPESVTGSNAGTIDDAFGAYQFNTFPLGLTVENLKAAFEYDMNDMSKLSGSISRSEGSNTEPSFSARFVGVGGADDPLLGFTYDIPAGVDGIPAVAINDPAQLSDLNNYTLAGDGLQFNKFVQEETVDEIRADYAYNTGKDAEGFGFKTGVKLRNLEKSFDNSSDRYSYTPTGGGDLNGGQFQLTTYNTPDHGFVVPIGNVAAVRSFFEANRADFTLNSPDSANVGGDFVVDESVTAIYALGTYETDFWSFIAGVRYEDTDIDTQAFLNNGTGFVPVSRSSSYDNFLPSLTATYKVADNMRIRGAISQAIGRPNFPDLARGESLTTTDNGTEITDIALSRGNPALEPRTSTNLDLSFDWFIDSGEYFSVAAFTKDIEDQITSVTSTLTDASQLGISLPLPVAAGAMIEVTQSQNGTDASVSGFEITYNNDSFTFAPSFGVFLNATVIDGEGDVSLGNGTFRSTNLLEQPEFLANASLLYNNGPIEGRLTFNHTGEYLEVISGSDATGNSDRTVSAYDQIDLALRYNVNETLALTFEGRNITDNSREKDLGPNQFEINKFGNSYWIGASLKF